jgi:hypothetical protein
MNKLLNVFFWTFAVLLMCLVVLKLFTGTLNEGMESEAKSGDLEVKVKYNSISMGKRQVFGYVVPYGIVWRTGSEEATEISFSRDCTFGNKPIKAGTYSLWTIPSEKKWTIILNKETGQYGTNYNEEKDYVRTVAKPKRLDARVDDLRLHTIKKKDTIALLIRLEYTEVEVDIL